MAADTASVGSAVPCPDPSAHQHGKGHDLSNAASTAALYATSHGKNSDSKEGVQQRSVLDADGKLSSSSAATSLKYAKAQDLPSFPSSGNAAGSASKAALLAKDYKMQELWQPELSAAGSKAALLAQQKGGKLDLWEASATKDGHSAATLAMRNKGLGPEIFQGSTPDNKNKALLAATMSVSQGRQRAGSTPAPVAPAYPDSHNSAANALSAATASHRTSTLKGDGWNSQSNQAARIVNSKVDRGMYTSDIHFESEDDRHQSALKASAMSMAKQIYETQNRSAMLADPDGGAGDGAEIAMARNQASSTSPDIKLEAMRYIHLQEAAHKLAAERLAKIDKDGEPARFREYYGYGGEDKPKRLSRMSMRSNTGRPGRKRASSEGTMESLDSDDEDQANRIRTQMSQLHSGIATVDTKKQQDDRARVMAAAEKRVSARMHDMDERVYADTGKISQAMQEEWEAKARQRAEKEREQRALHPGKTHIGGGKFMDQAEIEAIAAARLKPTLDAISDNAEQKRARDEELRIEKQHQEKLKMEETAQKQQQKEEFRKIRDADKAAAQKEKEEAKARKEEEKRLAKEEKRKSRSETVAVGAVGATHTEDNEPTTDTAADNGVERHRSVIARLKNRFRKSGAPGEAATTEDTVEKAETTEPAAHATTAATTEPEPAVNTGNVAGVATGATLAEVAHADEKPKEEAEEIDNGLDRDDTPPPMPISPVTIRETEPKPRASSEVSDSKWKPVSVPTTAAADGIILGDTPAIAVEDTSDDKAVRPPFEQKPSLSGLRSDNSHEEGNPMPNLERHISQIPESDDSDDSEDWNEDREDRKPVGGFESEHAHVVANRVITAPVTDKPAATAADPLPTSALTDETLSRLDEQRAEPPKDLPSTIQAPGVPKETTAAATTKPDVAATSSAATSSKVTSPTSEESSEKKEKGVRGFLHKLRHRRDASDTTSAATTPAPKSSTDSSAVPEAAGARTIPPVDVGPKFADVDSSDDDDDRGRKGSRSTGKLQKKMGFGNSRTTKAQAGEAEGRASTATAATSNPRSSGGDNETFEEARDHFDESLAPPPAFGGQAKIAEGGSPSRGTKFQEEL